MILKVTTILLFMWPIAVSGQYSLKGLVTTGNEPIIGATVYSVTEESGAVADVNGRFQLNLTSVLQSIEVRAIGYQTQRLSINLIEVKELDIELEESSLGLREVVITGTMQPKFITDSPVKVEVVTSEYMNTFSPSAASSIVENITLVNGVQEVTACGVCFTNSISINGLPGPYTAILMDGTPIYGNLASVYGLNGIPNMIIDRFEVIKGPSSTLYGSEAVAGVINIITKDPRDQPTFAVDVMATTHKESFGNIAGTVKTDRASGFIGLNYAYINDFDDDNNDGFGDNINLDRYSIFTKWNIERESGKPFTVAAKYFFEDRRNGVREFVEDRSYRQLRGDDTIYGESIYTHRAELFGTYSFKSNQNLKIDYSFSTHSQDSYYGSDQYVADQQIAFANLVWDKEYGDHHVLVGATNRWQRYDDNTVATENSDGSNNSNSQYIPGVFLQDEWSVTDKFTLLTGSRFDHYEAHGVIVSPRLNLKYKLGAWTSIRGNFGTGFRIVNLFTEDHAFVTGQRSVEIIGDLKPEQSYNGSVNLNHVYTIGSSQGMIDVDAFYTYFTNKIIPDYDTPDKIIYKNTSGHSVTKGIGFNLNHDFHGPISINAGFNLQDVTETEPNDEGVQETVDIEFAPVYTGVLTVNYALKKQGVTIGYTANVTGPMLLPEVYDFDENGNTMSTSRPTRSEAFGFHNIQLSKTIDGQWSVYGGVQNLFDYRQPMSPLVGYNDPNANVGFSDSFDTSYAYAPIHGREFYIGINFKLN